MEIEQKKGSGSSEEIEFGSEPPDACEPNSDSRKIVSSATGVSCELEG